MPFRPTAVSFSKSQKPSSKVWVARQHRDPYVKQRSSSATSYRARSAFKLLEIDSLGNNFLTKPDVKAVVDLGAAPGGWSQVVAAKLGWTSELEAPILALPSERFDSEAPPREKREKWRERNVRPKEAELSTFDPLNIEGDDFDITKGKGGHGKIVSVDLLKMQPIPGVYTIQADFLSPKAESLIRALLAVQGNPGGKIDIILSDMAANSSGNNTRDTESSLEICNAVFEFAQQNLRSAESIGRKRGGVLL
jgi:23S rRNA (uridine2552-2'-O)-methyltransferase